MDLIDEFDDPTSHFPTAPSEYYGVFPAAPSHAVEPEPIRTSSTELQSRIIVVRNKLFELYHSVFELFINGRCAKNTSTQKIIQSLTLYIKEYNNLLTQQENQNKQRNVS